MDNIMEIRMDSRMDNRMDSQMVYRTVNRMDTEIDSRINLPRLLKRQRQQLISSHKTTLRGKNRIIAWLVDQWKER